MSPVPSSYLDEAECAADALSDLRVTWSLCSAALAVALAMTSPPSRSMRQTSEFWGRFARVEHVWQRTTIVGQLVKGVEVSADRSGGGRRGVGGVRVVERECGGSVLEEDAVGGGSGCSGGVLRVGRTGGRSTGRQKDRGGTAWSGARSQLTR